MNVPDDNAIARGTIGGDPRRSRRGRRADHRVPALVVEQHRRRRRGGGRYVLHRGARRDGADRRRAGRASASPSGARRPSASSTWRPGTVTVHLRRFGERAGTRSSSPTVDRPTFAAIVFIFAGAACSSAVWCWSSSAPSCAVAGGVTRHVWRTAPADPSLTRAAMRDRTNGPGGRPGHRPCRRPGRRRRRPLPVGAGDEHDGQGEGGDQIAGERPIAGTVDAAPSGAATPERRTPAV